MLTDIILFGLIFYCNFQIFWKYCLFSDYNIDLVPEFLFGVSVDFFECLSKSLKLENKEVNALVTAPEAANMRPYAPAIDLVGGQPI